MTKYYKLNPGVVIPVNTNYSSDLRWVLFPGTASRVALTESDIEKYFKEAAPPQSEQPQPRLMDTSEYGYTKRDADVVHRRKIDPGPEHELVPREVNIWPGDEFFDPHTTQWVKVRISTPHQRLDGTSVTYRRPKASPGVAMLEARIKRLEDLLLAKSEPVEQGPASVDLRGNMIFDARLKTDQK